MVSNLRSITRKITSPVRSTINAAGRGVGGYVRQFGFLGDVVADTAKGIFGKSQNRTRSAGRIGGRDQVFSGVIVSLLTSIDKTLKSIYQLQLQNNTNALYENERLKKQDRLSSITPEKTTKEDGKSLLGKVSSFLMSGISGLLGLLGKLIPTGLMSILGAALGSIGSAITSLIEKAMIAAGIKKGIDLATGGSRKTPPGGKKIPTRPARWGARIGALGGLAGLAVAGIQHMSGQKDLDDQLKEGSLTPEEHATQTTKLRAGTAGTVAGGSAGAAVGSLAGPLGSLVGGAVGAVAGGSIASGAVDFADATRRPTQPKEGIGGKSDKALGGVDYDAYREAIGKRESNGKYNTENSLGYLGKYQFGAAALKDLGLVRPDAKGSNKEILSNPENWIKGMSKEIFLSNAALQEDLFRRFTVNNYREGRRLGIIKKNDTPSLVASKLAARHLSGWGNKNTMGARQYFESKGNIVAADAYGTKVSEYAKLGAASQINRLNTKSIVNPINAMSKGVELGRSSVLTKPLMINNVTAPVIQPVSPPVKPMGRPASGVPFGVETSMFDDTMLNINDLIRYNG